MNKITCLCFLMCLCLSDIITGGSALFASNDIQRVRVNFTTPTGYTRYLLLGFTPDNAATDAFDYGYDALCVENLPNDLNWRIGDKNYVIQGVGAFSTEKVYPFRMFLSNSGSVQITLNSLENFNNPVDVFIYDALLQTFAKINDTSFTADMLSGEYINRFFITFTDEQSVINYAVQGFLEEMSIADYAGKAPVIRHFVSSNTVSITSARPIQQVRIYDFSGKLLFEKPAGNSYDYVFNLKESGVNVPYSIVQVQTDIGLFNHKIIR